MNGTPEWLPYLNTVLATVNLFTLVSLAFWGGRWTGRIETRIGHLEAAEAQRARWDGLERRYPKGE